MRHDDEVPRPQPMADRRDERRMKLAKMRIRRRPKLRGERPNKLWSETELRELEVQQSQEMLYRRGRPQGYDVELITSEHADVSAPAGLIVLEESGVWREAGANLLQTE